MNYMSFHTDDLDLASNFQPEEGEANFASPIMREVQGGAHITFELLTKQCGHFYMTRWPNGLPRHDPDKETLRFPHGLIKFGETVEQCCTRLAYNQLGMELSSSRVINIDSYVDSANHWHIEVWCVVEVVTFTRETIPSDITCWEIDELKDTIDTYITEND